MRIQVPGDGPVPSSTMFVGESPGWQEVKASRPFVGKAGNELWHWSPFLRKEVYVTNLIKFRPPDDRDPYPNEIEEYSEYLEDEVERVNPKLVVTLGRFSARFFLGDGYDYDRDHGLPHRRGSRVIFPILHPAAGMHEPQLYTFFWRDMLALRAYVEGRLHVPQPNWPIDYRVVEGIVGEPYDAVDTEGDANGLISIQLSDGPGRSQFLDAGGEWSFQPPVIYHNARHDLKALGLNADPETFEDTMLLARLCGDLKAGLKSLSLRLVGMNLRKFPEVVGPYVDAQVKEWLEDVRKNYTPVHKIGKKGQNLKATEPKPEWVKAVDRCLRSPRARTLWADQKPSIHAEVAALGVRETPLYSLRAVPREEMVQYACGDADATGRIFPLLWARHKALGLGEVYQIDKRQFAILNSMEKRGIEINPPAFHEVSRELDFLIDSEMDCIGEMWDVPKDFSPTSPQQTSELIYNTLGLQPRGRVKRTKGGMPSSDDAYLQAMKNQHPVVQKILNIREAAKLKSSYTTKIPRIVDAHNKYYPDFGFTITGRLTESLLLLIPKRSSWGMGKKIRRGFVPGKGLVFGSWDLSQIELRVLASDSQDPTLIAAYTEGIDLHAATATRVLGAPEGKANQSDGKHRIPAKTLNFGIPMGLSADGLLREILQALADNGATEGELDEWNTDRTQQMIDDWYNVAYPVAGAFLRGKAEEARQTNRVTDFLGRTRWLPAINSPNEMTRAKAERDAQSFSMQAGAQEVAKMWQWNIWNRICKVGLAEAVLLVHDDSLMAFPESHWDEMQELMIDTLPQVLKVPVEAEGKIGETWGEI